MTCNMGNGDRIFRVIVGVVILLGGLILKSWWGLLGLIPLLTASVRYCPLYVPFKIDTRPKTER